MSEYSMLIAGKSVPGEGTYDVLNPATEEVVGQAPNCSREQLDQAMAAAAEAFPAWSADREARREAILRAADALEAAAGELGPLLIAEQGKPLLAAEFEASLPGRWLRHFADLEYPQEELLEENEPPDGPPPPHVGGRSVLTRRPMGVVAAITPWNFPIYQFVEKLAPALITGNTFVIKPSPYTPLTSLRIGEIIRDIFPAGVVNVVSGGNDLGSWITSHPTPRKISFTGSTESGRKVGIAAAEDFKRVTLELGGNDPALVLPDADLDDAAPKIFGVATGNCGQICNGIKRVYAHESHYDELVEKLAELARGLRVGPGTDPEVGMGPLQNKAQFERVKELTEDALANGAVAVAGGGPLNGPGYFFAPTVLRDVRDGMRIVDEEQFGPVIPVIKYSDVEDAIASANGTHFGLASSVWTRDPKEAWRVADRLEAGSTYINDHLIGGERICYGGVKWSGVGVSNGIQGLLGYTEIKVTSTALVWPGGEVPAVMESTGVS